MVTISPRSNVTEVMSLFSVKYFPASASGSDPGGLLWFDPLAILFWMSVLARYVEKKWIRFEPLKNSWTNVALCLVGLIPMPLLKQFVNPLIVGWLGSHWGKLLFSVIYAFYYIAFFPLVLKFIGKMEQKAEV